MPSGHLRQAADKLAKAGIEIVEACPDFSRATESFGVLRALSYVANTRALWSPSATS